MNKLMRIGLLSFLAVITIFSVFVFADEAPSLTYVYGKTGKANVGILAVNDRTGESNSYITNDEGDYAISLSTSNLNDKISIISCGEKREISLSQRAYRYDFDLSNKVCETGVKPNVPKLNTGLFAGIGIAVAGFITGLLLWQRNKRKKAKAAEIKINIKAKKAK